jgi:hypothetical protein
LLFLSASIRGLYDYASSVFASTSRRSQRGIQRSCGAAALRMVN